MIDMPEIPAALAPAVALAINVLKALVLLVVGWLVAARVSAFVRNRITRSRRIDQTIGIFASNAVRYLLLIAVVIAVLQTFGFQVTSLVAVLGAATLAIGLALQGTLSHLAAGLMILIFRPYKLGDFVEISGEPGTVSDLNLFLTEITAVDGVKKFVPNGDAWGNTITNYTLNPLRRCDITFGIDYGDDVDAATAVIRGIVEADSRFLDKPDPPFVKLTNLGQSSLDIEVRAWCKSDDMWAAKHDTLKAVKEAFDANGISIPYPHQVNVEKHGAA